MIGVWTVVVAAGRSERFGSPKLRAELGSDRVIDHSLRTAISFSDGVVLVTDDEQLAADHAVKEVVAGGRTRSESVRNGLVAVPKEVARILIHDAARPAASLALYKRVAAALMPGVDAVVPAIPVVDTIKRVAASRVVVETLDRVDLVAVQTPQAFDREALESAHAAGGEATDDAALIEFAGGTVIVVEGEIANVKLTSPRDLEVVRSTWRAGQEDLR